MLARMTNVIRSLVKRTKRLGSFEDTLFSLSSMNLILSTFNESSLFFWKREKKKLHIIPTERQQMPRLDIIKDVNHLTPVRYPHKHSCRYVWGSYVWVQTRHSNIRFQSISTQAFYSFCCRNWMKFCSRVRAICRTIGPSLTCVTSIMGKVTEVS